MTLPGTRPVPGGLRRAEPGQVLPLLLVLGLAACTAGAFVPSVGAPVFAVAGGVLLSRAARRLPDRAAGREPVLDVARGPVLRLSIVLLGAQLSLGEVVSVGVGSIPVMLGTLAVCLLLAALVGRRLGIPSDLRTLIGVGTGICGASAIAAVTPALRAKSGDVAYAISTIFFFNVAAVLVFAVSAIVLNGLLLRGGQVPRWLAWWGLAGGCLLLLRGFAELYGSLPLAAQAVCAAPIGVQEMVFAGWLIVKGVRP